MPAANQTHSPTPEEIMEYLDGEGRADARLVIEAHLAGCLTCQEVASGQRRLSAAAGAWRIELPPASLRAPEPRRASLLSLPGRFPSWRSLRAPLVIAGTLAATVFTAVWIDRPAPQSAVSASDGAEKAEPRRWAEAAPTRTAQASAPVEDPTTGSTVAPYGSSARGVVGSGNAIGGSTAPLWLGGQEQPRPPSIIRTATLRIVAKEFDGVRQSVEGIVAAAGGFLDQMTVSGDTGTARALRATLRIPGDRLAEVADALRNLGQVVEDTQSSEDVGDQLVDLAARLAGARATERRLIELLRDRTGKLSEVLEVEGELARVRVDIERLDAQNTNLGRRITYATLNLAITEERKEGLASGSLSLTSRIRVAAADGLESALASVTWMLLAFLRAGPLLVLWAAGLGAGWLLVRRVRHALPPASGPAPPADGGPAPNAA